MITAKQLRAARSLLGWDQKVLAHESTVSLPTVQRMEGSDGIVKGNAENVWKIQQTLEKAGIIFLSADDTAGVGVRLRK